MTGFSAIDYAVLLLYLVGITVLGTLFRRSHRTVKDYLSDVYRHAVASWNFGFGDCGDLCGSNVQFERFAELAFIDDGARSLQTTLQSARFG